MSDPDDDRLVKRAKEIVPVLAEKAQAIELNRCLPQALTKLLAGAGFYNMCAPIEFGGEAASPLTYAQVIETLATGDASAAWCSFIATSTAFAYASGGSDAIRALMAVKGVVFAGAFAPMGVASEQVRAGVSGYVVSGHWAWGSGSQNADWISGGCVIESPAGNDPGSEDTSTQIMHLLFSKNQIEFQDSWHVMGLRGTGSTHFRVRDAFVPNDRAISVKDSKSREHTIFQFPVFGMLSLGIGAVSLGIAQAALSEAKNVAMTKRSPVSRRPMFERASVRIALGKAEVSLRAARSLFHQEIVTAWRAAIDGTVDLDHRLALRLAINFAVETAKTVTLSAFEQAGGSAIHNDSVLQRQLRDVLVAGQHIMVGDDIYDIAGRCLLDRGTDTSMI
jgi:alkylation response protein AidB-like acyl-CoA dehydrogenase